MNHEDLGTADRDPTVRCDLAWVHHLLDLVRGQGEAFTYVPAGNGEKKMRNVVSLVKHQRCRGCETTDSREFDDPRAICCVRCEEINREIVEAEELDDAGEVF